MPCSSGRQPGQRIPKSQMMAARGSWLLHHLRRKALPMRENEKRSLERFISRIIIVIIIFIIIFIITPQSLRLAKLSTTGYDW